MYSDTVTQTRNTVLSLSWNLLCWFKMDSSSVMTTVLILYSYMYVEPVLTH